MLRKRKIAIWVIALVAAGTMAAVLSSRISRSGGAMVVAGAVLRQDTDPNKQHPIGNALISAVSSTATGDTKSDVSGLFRLRLQPSLPSGELITLRFRHADYHPLDMATPAGDQLHVVRMRPKSTNETQAPPNQPGTSIADVRVRYAVKTTTTVNVGSAVKTFEIVNTGNIPCRGQPPCSPDGKWKAEIHSESLDAGEGNHFRNARVSCIAGPCPFTRVEADGFSRGGRTIKVSVRNWSDTATYLVEAEVVHTMMSDMIRHSYPVIFGEAMNFTLPATAQGPTIEAELDGAAIVFPLGPNLILSWANCRLEVGSDRTKHYRCELKPGFRFE
jgi:hypothetical protein